MWGTRDDARACPEARRAANDAMDAIDACLANLHALRRSLVSEIRVSDDANAIRVDELLAKGGQCLSPRGRHAAWAARPNDEPWTLTSDRAVWRAYKRGLVLTVTHLADGGWQATVEGPGVTERSPMPFRTRKRAQAWEDNRPGGAS